MKVFILLLSVLFFFAGCNNISKEKKNALSDEDKKIEIEKGKLIAGQTFTALSTRLQKAIKEGGVPNAIQLCNLEAYPIVDSLSREYNADIKRTTLKVRNQKNKATEAEKQILQNYQQMQDGGADLKPIVNRNNDGSIGFHAPIKMSAMCLNCHGILGESLTTDNYSYIQRYYPEDMAVNYKEGDLRGMWSITFHNESSKN